VRVRTAKPRAAGYRLLDGDGLHLFVTPAGMKSWRWRYQRDGREHLVVLGSYPAMGLSDARAKRDARLLDLQRGKDPRARPETTTLESVARLWHASQKPLWKPHHAADVLASLERELFPALGKRPIGEITAPALLAALKPVQQRGAIELGHRLRQRLAAVFAYAAAAGLVDHNPAAGLEAALMPVVRQRRRPAALDLVGAQVVLKAAEATPAHPTTRLALRLLALTAVRPGELRLGAWSEIEDLEGQAPLWRIPAARMKHARERQAAIADHLVPLARQSVETLLALRTLTGRGALLFPSWSNPRKAMSENALVYHLQRAGQAGQHVPHGWRATFSTIMNERDPRDAPIIDLMLAHTPPNAVEAAYNRAQHMDHRRALAQAWANLLLAGLPSPAELLGLRRK
jgi:integrase